MTLTLPNGTIDLRDIPGDKDKPPLILLHEGLGSVGLWRDFPDQLANATYRRTLAFSRYGHGNSDPPSDPRTPDFMHEEALDVLPNLLTAMSIEAPVLIGHSDGASIALIHAAHHPVTAVVAIAPHVFVEEMCLTEIRRVRTAYETTDLRERMARHHRDPDAAFYGWNDVWLNPKFKTWDVRPLLDAITAPILLIQGTRDQYGTMAQLDAIEHAAAGPTYRVHLECQHGPQTEKPTETVAAITKFVTALPRRSGISPPPAARTRR